MYDTDGIDKELITLLRSNSRLPVVDIAKKLGLARATVQNRLNRLERDGIILNYTINVKPKADINPIKAIVSIAAETKKEANAVKALAGMPEVVSLHHTTGRWDIIAEVHTDTLVTLNQALSELRLIDGITSTETNLLLDSKNYGASILRL